MDKELKQKHAHKDLNKENPHAPSREIPRQLSLVKASKALLSSHSLSLPVKPSLMSLRFSEIQDERFAPVQAKDSAPIVRVNSSSLVVEDSTPFTSTLDVKAKQSCLKAQTTRLTRRHCGAIQMQQAAMPDYNVALFNAYLRLIAAYNALPAILRRNFAP